MKIKKILIGLEIHVELKTESKMFCGCMAESFGLPSNSQTCPVCLGLPGALPVPNKKAIEWTIHTGLALNCQIPRESKFDRKNYFYPDLPKGYQISQYDMPFAINGELKLKTQSPKSRSTRAKLKTVKIRRVHLEEDTGKSIHTEDNGEKVTLLDFNKSGIPLIEIVSDPDMNSVEEALSYCERVRKTIKYLEVSDCDLEKGQMRFEPTINLLIEDGGKDFFTPLVELKNINSFRFLKKALEFEIDRQFKEFSEKGIAKTPGNKTTRGFDQEKMITFEQRHKEEAEEYRYFPEPDIPPFEWSDEEISNFKLQISKIVLPDVLERKFREKYQLLDTQIDVLTEEKSLAKFFEECVEVGEGEGIDTQEIANIIINKRVDFQNLSPTEFVRKIGESKSKFSLEEEEIIMLAKEVLDENPKLIEDYKRGKTQVIGFLIGLVQKKAAGKADPRIAQKILLEKISS